MDFLVRFMYIRKKLVFFFSLHFFFFFFFSVNYIYIYVFFGVVVVVFLSYASFLPHYCKEKKVRKNNSQYF